MPSVKKRIIKQILFICILVGLGYATFLSIPDIVDLVLNFDEVAIGLVQSVIYLLRGEFNYYENYLVDLIIVMVFTMATVNFLFVFGTTSPPFESLKVFYKYRGLL
ncbi:MAG: hypothetical protein ACFFDC_11955 [Promethearchaeota archaeon]